MGRHLAVLAKLYFSRLSHNLSRLDIDRYYSVLIFVDKSSGTVTQQDIGDYLEIDKATMVRVIDGFVEKDYLKRNPDPNDRRCHNISLTGKGKSVIPVIQQAIDELEKGLLEDISEADQRIFRNVICRITGKLKNASGINQTVNKSGR